MLHNCSPEIFKINGVGVDLEHFFPLKNENERIQLRASMGFSLDDFILIYTAEFIHRKNHRFLFDIFPDLKRKIPNLKVVLCGKGELFEYYRTFAADNNMDFIIFTGYVRNIVDWCHISDVLVMPSFQEGLPMAMIEAFATGLPVVASNIRGHCDVLEDCVNGFLCDMKNRQNFVKAIYVLYKNPSLRSEMGQRNIEKAKLFSISSTVCEMENIYNKLM